MATNTMPAIPQARRQGFQGVNTLKKTVNYNDAGISSGIAFAESLPIGAFITGWYVEIVTTFDGTPTLTVGTNSTSFNDIVNSADVTEGTAGVYTGTRGWGRSLAATAEKVVKVKLAATSPSQGVAVIVITYEGGWST